MWQHEDTLKLTAGARVCHRRSISRHKSSRLTGLRACLSCFSHQSCVSAAWVARQAITRAAPLHVVVAELGGRLTSFGARLRRDHPRRASTWMHEASDLVVGHRSEWTIYTRRWILNELIFVQQYGILWNITCTLRLVLYAPVDWCSLRIAFILYSPRR